MVVLAREEAAPPGSQTEEAASRELPPEVVFLGLRGMDLQGHVSKPLEERHQLLPQVSKACEDKALVPWDHHLNQAEGAWDYHNLHQVERPWVHHNLHQVEKAWAHHKFHQVEGSWDHHNLHKIREASHHPLPLQAGEASYNHLKANQLKGTQKNQHRKGGNTNYQHLVFSRRNKVRKIISVFGNVFHRLSYLQRKPK